MTRPLLMAHRAGEKLGFGDNTLASIQESLRCGATLIELDIRKSKDEILYCYHGSLLEVIFSKFLLSKSFSQLKSQHLSLLTLESVLASIPSHIPIFLDIKDSVIAPEELVNFVKGRIGTVYVSGFFFLKKLCKYKILEKHVPSLCLVYIIPHLFGYNFEKLKNNGIHTIQLFHWSFNQENIQKLMACEINFALCPMFISRENYSKKIDGTSPHYIHAL